ncbi:MAG: pyruvate kinase [Minisyncoccia bacterium]
MTNSRAQIVATIGPASENDEVILEMIESGVDVVRFNLSWADLSQHLKHMDSILKVSRKLGRKIPVLLDLPGPRIQTGSTHTYDKSGSLSVTEKDEGYIKFGVENVVDYFALSFVGSGNDVVKCREIIKKYGGNQKIIAKIERAEAVEKIDEIISTSDGIMVARGDLGEEVPLEKIPFVQEEIIRKAKYLNKPVIVATQLLLSMVEKDEPTRAEVSDVATAIMEGADAVMLSDETAIGKYPIQAVKMMDKIIVESEKHEGAQVNYL